MHGFYMMALYNKNEAAAVAKAIRAFVKNSAVKVQKFSNAFVDERNGEKVYIHSKYGVYLDAEGMRECAARFVRRQTLETECPGCGGTGVVLGTKVKCGRCCSCTMKEV